jgi:hypothetical protein
MATNCHDESFRRSAVAVPSELLADPSGRKAAHCAASVPLADIKAPDWLQIDNLKLPWMTGNMFGAWQRADSPETMEREPVRGRQIHRC